MAAKQNVWKPTAIDCATIRTFAKCHTTGMRRLELGSRCNTEQPDIPVSVNIAQVAKTECWGDTDLHDMISWSVFRAKGVPLTEDGRAILDFYVYDNWGLNNNITVYVKNGAIHSMSNTGRFRQLTF